MFLYIGLYFSSFLNSHLFCSSATSFDLYFIQPVA